MVELRAVRLCGGAIPTSVMDHSRKIAGQHRPREPQWLVAGGGRQYTTPREWAPHSALIPHHSLARRLLETQAAA